MEFPTFRVAWKHLIKECLENGYEVNSERGKVKFLNNVHIVINNPKAKFLPQEYPFKENAIRYVENFFSDEDDNFVYSYKNRLRKHFGIDQLKAIEERLKNNLYTRRAIAVTFDPRIDHEQDDIPCLIALQFQVVDNKLDMTTFMRSQDLFLAFPSNMLLFTTIQTRLCNSLGIRCGKLYHYVTNLHIYVERDKDLLGDLIV